MATDSFFALACTAIIAFVFGLALCFGGYRFFLLLLPIWGFFFGFVLGAQAVTSILGDAFLATITSWVVGFVVGALFAVLSYLFYIVAVAIIAGSLGYAIATGLLLAIGLPMGFIVWIVGVVGAVAMAGATLFLNLQKWVIMIATAVLGAGVILGGFLILFAPGRMALENPVVATLQASPLLLIVFIVTAAAGVFVQWRTGMRWTVTEYNRWEDTATGIPAA
ncbi:MAG: DUF4203 domain-containing protein [Anaerolineae bacterium]|nr:DUF4203 domain-containing protein [Anaerolineae bacterium]